MLKQIVVHEVVIALRIVSRQTHVFIQVEGDDFGEIHLTCLVSADQLSVYAYGRATCSKAEDAMPLSGSLAVNGFNHTVCQQHRKITVVSDDDRRDAFQYS